MVDMKLNTIDDHPAGMSKASRDDVDFSKLETELKDHALEQEVCVCNRTTLKCIL